MSGTQSVRKRRWNALGFIIFLAGIALAVLVPILLKAHLYLFRLTPQGEMRINLIPAIILACWVFLTVPGSIVLAAVLGSVKDKPENDA